MQGLGVPHHTFFHARGFAVVGEEVGQQPQVAVAIALEQGHRRAIVRADLQSQVGAIMFAGAGFGRFQQALADTVAPGPWLGGDGVQAREGAALAEQHQGVAEDAAVALGQQQAGVGFREHPAELLATEARRLEAMALKLHQRRQVVERGGT
ncbi:hypothetical protein D9M68_856020 [compost metagenome]